MKRWGLASIPFIVVALIIMACGGKGTNPVAPAGVNRPPEIRRIELVGYNVAGYNSSLPLDVTVVDPDGDQVRCSYQPSAGKVLLDGSSSNTCRATYVAPGAGLTDAIGVTATDSKGASTGSSATLALGPESIPSQVATVPTPPPGTPGPGPTPTPTPTPTPPPPPPGNRNPTVSVSAAASTCHPRPTTPCTVQVTATASDPDGDPITYAWSGCASGSGTTATCTVSALSAHKATVTVSDGRGGTAKAETSITGVNSAPTGYAVATSSTSCHPACSATYFMSVTDGDGDPLTYTWWGCASGTSPTATCSVTALGINTAYVQATDGWATLNSSGDATGTNGTPNCWAGDVSHFAGEVSFGYDDPDSDPLDHCSATCTTCTISGCNASQKRVSFNNASAGGTINITVCDRFNACSSCTSNLVW